MALTQRSRSVLYQKLSDLLDEEEAVGEMLSCFPARDTEEPATKAHLDALASQMDAKFSQMDARIAQMETRLTATFNEQMAGFNAQMRTMVQWTLGAMVALIGLVVAMGFLQAP